MLGLSKTGNHRPAGTRNGCTYTGRNYAAASLRRLAARDAGVRFTAILSCLRLLVAAVTIAAAFHSGHSGAMASESMSAPKYEAQRSTSGTPVACSEATEQAESLNGLELFQASASCFREGKRFEGNLLLIAGQIRSLTDFALLRPLDDADEVAMSELYGTIFYRTGGTGDDELYRDPVLTEELFRQLTDWSPSFSDEYDPGWNYKRKVTPGSYEKIANKQKAHRLAQVQHYAVLIRRDDYYAASEELHKLQKRNPRGFVANSDDAQRAVELTNLMRQIGQGIESPMPESEGSEEFRFEPDPDANFRQLFVGTNGPASDGVTVLESSEEVKGSWLPKAMARDRLAEILSDVNFEHQVLIAFAVGERTTATGTLYITDVSYNADLEFMSVVGRVGVNERNCHFPAAKSYLFALAVAERPPTVPEFPSFSVANFGDGCKPPSSGQPSE